MRSGLFMLAVVLEKQAQRVMDVGVLRVATKRILQDKQSLVVVLFVEESYAEIDAGKAKGGICSHGLPKGGRGFVVQILVHVRGANVVLFDRGLDARLRRRRRFSPTNQREHEQEAGERVPRRRTKRNHKRVSLP